MQDIYLSSAQVCARYGEISPVTLWRWLKDPETGFPQPMRLNGQRPNARRLWKLSELETWERARAAHRAMEAA